MDRDASPGRGQLTDLKPEIRFVDDLYAIEFILVCLAIGLVSLVCGVLGAWNYMAEEIRKIEGSFARGLAWGGAIVVLPFLAALFAVFSAMFFFGLMSAMTLLVTLGPILVVFSAAAYHLSKNEGN